MLTTKISNVRKAAHDKLSKKVELTNINTGVVLILDSLNGTARYLQTLGPEYSKAQPGTITSNIKTGSLYNSPGGSCF